MSIKAANNVFPHDPDDNWKQKLDRGGYEGTAKDLDDKINAIKNPDGILIAGSISKLGNVISIGEMTFKCRIDNNVLTNIEDFSTTIINATENYKRIDILVFTKFSTIVKIQGDEELESAKEPDVPPGTIKLSFISVFGSQINDPSQPILIPDISEKLDKGGFVGTAQDIINSIPGPVDISGKLDKGGYIGNAQDLKNSIPDLNATNLKFGGYPNTRNDGQISMNKVLGTDAQGNLKMYTIATAPAPFLDELIPDSYLPNNTGNFILKGSFFTPTMTVVIEGQTINYLTFISDNEVHANVTTGSAEGMFSVTLDNGLSSVFPDSLFIVLGTIFMPEASDWLSVVAPLDVTTPGEAKIGYWNTLQSALWNKQFDYTRDFRVQFRVRRSPLGDPSNLGEYLLHAYLSKVSDGGLVGHAFWMFDDGYQVVPRMHDGNFQGIVNLATILYYPTDYWETNIQDNVIEYRYVNGVLYAYYNSVLKSTFSVTLTENVRLQINLKRFDLVGIKYIETL